MGKIFALLALASGTAAANTGTGPVQYGALGLCGVMVVFLISHIKAQAEIIKAKDEKLTELLTDDIKAKNRLAEALEDRPCICEDSRVKD